MIKLTAVEPQPGPKLLLRFSDGAWGVYDFSKFIASNTPMTAPLADRSFFARHFIELGALAWPNGFDLSAGSLYRTLEEEGALNHSEATA